MRCRWPAGIFGPADAASRDNVEIGADTQKLDGTPRPRALLAMPRTQAASGSASMMPSIAVPLIAGAAKSARFN